MTMLLQGRDGSEFELGLIEDRLPEIQDGFGDGAALVLSFRVATPDESWEETSPCLNTFEVKNLAEWLEAVAEGPAARPDEPELDLLEPELNFQLVEDDGDEVVLRVGFHLEDRPEIFEVDAPTDEAPHVDLRVTREHLRTAAAQLRDDLETIGRPDRGGTAGGGGGVERVPREDDLTGDTELGAVRPPTEELGIDMTEVPDERVGFGSGLDEGEEAIFREEEDEEEER